MGVTKTPGKSNRWVNRKYFSSVGSRNWVLKSGDVELIEMDKIPIVRHVKIRKDANPFDTDYSEYFRKRSDYHLFKDNTNSYWKDEICSGVDVERCLIQA
jgi:hypothetical protein